MDYLKICEVKMDERIYLSNLYDYYGVLLTERQKEYFEDYYFNNLTLAEIAENNNVSRNAIHKQLKEVEEKLSIYEKKLQLYNKGKRIKELIKTVDEKLIEQIEELI